MPDVIGSVKSADSVVEPVKRSGDLQVTMASGARPKRALARDQPPEEQGSPWTNSRVLQSIVRAGSEAVAMSVYATPRHIVGLDDCYFYHTADVPGHGVVHGEWDLRGHEHEYLGNVPLAGKRVLEIGAASGGLSFWMERQGTDVTALDISPDHGRDLVSFPGFELDEARWRESINRLNNSWWLQWRLLGSRARKVYANVYDVPAELGAVDIATFGSVLLHLRDPFAGLESALRNTSEAAIVTDVYPGPNRLVRALNRAYFSPQLHNWLGRPTMQWLPDVRTRLEDAWWLIHPKAVVRMVEVLGFPDTTISYHRQQSKNGPVLLYTVVARRMAAAVPPRARG